jgi:hypothetical protein
MQVYSIEVSGKSKKLKKKNIPVSLIHCQSFAETEFCMSKNCFTIQNEKKTFNMIKKQFLTKNFIIVDVWLNLLQGMIDMVRGWNPHPVLIGKKTRKTR